MAKRSALLIFSLAAMVAGAPALADGRNTVRERRQDPRRAPAPIERTEPAPSSEERSAIVEGLDGAIVVVPWECYDKAKDCGDEGDRYCSARGGVAFQSYDPSAEVPCRFTCANGEGGTCKKRPENSTPKPQPNPGDVTLTP